MVQLESLDTRIPDWGSDQLNDRSCPFCCSNNEELLIRPDKLPLAFCSTCACWYLNKIPTESSISNFYNGYFFRHRPSEISAKSAINFISNVKTSYKSDWQLQTLSKLLNGLKGKRVLEVGCGLGRFLLSAKFDGADVIGCDLSPEACNFAQQNLGLNVHCATLKSCMSSISAVDAVIMRDFIEHPTDPLFDIEAAYTLLKPGGLLLFHTPNGGEAGRSVETGKQWVGFRVDLEHMQYLSPNTINWLAKKQNMLIERLGAFGHPGLKDIKLLSAKKKSMITLKSILKSVPVIRILHKSIHALNYSLKNKSDPRLGNYHLFAVLRK